MAHTFFCSEDMTIPQSGGDYDAALGSYYRLCSQLTSRSEGQVVRDGFVVRQVHSGVILEADVAPSQPLLPTVVGEADGVWTSMKNVWVGVFTADCLPILVDGGDRVMAIHAGWRGFAAGIIRRGVEIFDARSIRCVTLGPAASGCCYEVGEEVFRALETAGIEPVAQGRNLDLPLTAERHLRELGVARIERTDPFGCTICDRRFRSYRRDAAGAGRHLTGIML